MALPFVSLDAVSAIGAGTTRDLEGLADHHTLIAWTTGNPSSAVVILEGSHDGSNWVFLGSASLGGSTLVARLTVPDSNIAIPGALVRYVRARLATLTEGTSPTVSATIASDTTEED